MKTLLHYTKLTFLALILGTSTLSAQTTIDINYVNDSIVNYCPLPSTINLEMYGSATGYDDVTDNITIQVFWGDGSNNTYIADLFDGGTFDLFSAYPPHTYTMAGTYSPMIIATGPDGNADTLYAAGMTFTAGCVLIDGYTYQDNNSNCIFDAGDDTLAGAYVSVVDASGNSVGYAGSDIHGYYSMYLPTGLSSLSISAYYTYMTTTCPTSGSYTFGTSSSSSFNFALDCASSSTDYFVYPTTPSMHGAPGSTGILSFVAGLYGCPSTSGIPATITVTLDPLISYSGMITGPAPTSISGSVLTWSTTLVPAGYSAWMHLSFQTTTSTSAVVMTPSCYDIDITGPGTDPDLTNNMANTCLIIGGPYDPNNKEVLPAGIGSTGNVAPETEFVYTLNFQNTGTAPAINVYVMDTISNNLDMSTFQIIGSSHDMHPIFTDAHIVRFDFPNINLPDSNANEALSHGWVKYRIKAKSGLVHGTQIENTGHIYFDYNAPIVTNTTLNTIDITLGINTAENETQTFAVYPNPSGTYVNINAPGAEGSTALVYDVTGKVVATIAIDNTTTTLDVSSWTNGLYEIVIPESNFKTVRFQKMD